MAKRDVVSRYAGSFLGILWSLIHPAVLILVFWVVFSLGFKVRPANDVPFVVWLTAGLAAWFFFAESVTGAVSSLVIHANLIKKTVFQSQILPLVKLMSCLVQHGFFVFLLMVLMLINGIGFDLYWFQGLYYLVCSAVLALGIGWSVAALNVFIRDMEQATVMGVQIGFWATPVFWDIKMLPLKIQAVLKLNPMYYVVQGYRESFIYHVPFWNHPILTLYFWSVALALFIAGVLVFTKLKPQFADVL